MAKTTKTPPAAVASLNPDDMLAGGLRDDFDARIVKARFAPWDYEGKIDHPVLALALTIQPDEEDEPFVQHYSAGNLEDFAPSADGQNPVDLESGEGEELEGIYAVRVGRKEQLNNNTNFAHFLGALIDAGFDRAEITPQCSFLEGLYGHWNRIPQKKRSGIVVQPTEGGRERRNDILVITELKEAEAPKPAAKAAPKGAKPAAKVAAAESTNGNPLDDAIVAAITEALAAADGTMPKSKVPGAVIKAFTGQDKAKAVKRASELAFLEEGGGGAWVYDADEGTLTAL